MNSEDFQEFAGLYSREIKVDKRKPGSSSVERTLGRGNKEPSFLQTKSVFGDSSIKYSSHGQFIVRNDKMQQLTGFKLL